MMARVTVEGIQEDLWSWWMLIMMAGKLFINRKVTNILPLLFYKVHSDCCGQFWAQETDRVWPEASRLHQADP